MVRQAIYKKNKWHMWLFYYYHFTEVILKQVPERNDSKSIENWGNDWPTNYLKLIYRMTSNIWCWYDAMADAPYAGLTKSISKCMSGILLEIANSNSIGNEWKTNQFKLYIKIYCHISAEPLKEGKEEESSAVKKQILESLEEVMIKPSYIGETTQYHRLLKDVWTNKFDKSEYDGLAVLSSLQINVFDKIH